MRYIIPILYSLRLLAISGIFTLVEAANAYADQRLHTPLWMTVVASFVLFPLGLSIVITALSVEFRVCQSNNSRRDLLIKGYLTAVVRKLFGKGLIPAKAF